MKRKTWVFLLISVALIAVGVGIYLDHRPKNISKTIEAAPAKQKVYLIGIDGASWNLMQKPLSEGKLPNIQKLIQGGSFGPLKSFIPTKSPVLWTSIATGKTQLKHGIGDFTAEKDGKMIPVSGGQRITKAYWNILTDYGLSVGVVNWWVTWPAEKINGFMVSDRYRNYSKKSGDEGLTYPAALLSELPKVGISKDRFVEEEDKFGLPTKVPPKATSKNVDIMFNTYKSYWGQDKAVREICRRMLAKQNVDVFGVVFRIVDVSCHLYWTYLDQQLVDGLREKDKQGKLTKEDIAHIDGEFAKIIEPIYIYADHIVGDFLKYQDANTNVIICSDHGFKFEDGRYGHSGMTTPPDGVIILNGPLFRKNYKIEGATLLDITPTLLFAEGIPIGRDMDGKVLFKAFNPDFLQKHPPTLVASHDKGERQKGEPASSAMDQEILDDLKSLGYIQ